MSCQFQTGHERQILFRDQKVDSPFAFASPMPGFQTMRSLKNAKTPVAKQIAWQLAEPRTVDICRQQDGWREPGMAEHSSFSLITLSPYNGIGNDPVGEL